MQVTPFLLFFACGVFAVSARKGSKEDENDYDVVQLWSCGQSGIKTLVVKNPKMLKPPSFGLPYSPSTLRLPQPPSQQTKLHLSPLPVQIPEPTQPIQPPQPFKTPQLVQQPESFDPLVFKYGLETQRIDPNKAYQYLQLIQNRMEEFSAKFYKEYQMLEKEISRSQRHLEDDLRVKYKAIERYLEAKKNKKIEQAVREGRDGKVVLDCLYEKEENLRMGMMDEFRRSSECINECGESAMKTFTGKRNSFMETARVCNDLSKEWGTQMKICIINKNSTCVENGLNVIEKKVNNTIENGNQLMLNILETSQKHMVELNFCRQNFLGDIKILKNAYVNAIRNCVLSSSIKKIDDSEEDEEEEEYYT